MNKEEIKKWYSSLGKKSWTKHPHSKEHMREIQRKSVIARMENKKKKLSINKIYG